jgi:hypothetical protein
MSPQQLMMMMFSSAPDDVTNNLPNEEAVGDVDGM